MKHQAATITRGLASLGAWLVAAVGATWLLIHGAPEPTPRTTISLPALAVAGVVAALVVASVTQALSAANAPTLLQTVVATTLGAVAWILLLDARHPDTRLVAAIADRPAVCVVVLFGTPLLTLFGTLVHESGHAIAGRVVGLRLAIIRVGPLIGRRHGNRLRLRRFGPLTASGGFMQCIDGGREPRWWRRTVLAAGGPFADVVLLSVALVCDGWLRRNSADARSLTAALAVTVAAVGGASFLRLCWFVMGSQDRKIIEQSLKRPRVAAQQTLHPSQLTLHEGPVADADTWRALSQLRRALAYRDAAAARAFGDRLLEASTYRYVDDSADVLLEVAYLTARLGEPDDAELLIAKARKDGIVSPSCELRAVASVRLARGDLVAARAAAQAGLDHHSVQSGDAPFDRELLLEMRVAASDPDFAAAWLGWQKF